MKKAGCALFGCAALIALLIGGALGILWQAAPEEGAPASAPAPSMTAESVPEPTAPAQGTPTPRGGTGTGRLRLTFHFRDADDEPQELRCEIRRADLESEEARFGIVEAKMTEELNRELEAHLRQAAAARGVDRYFDIEAYGEGSIRWTYRVPRGSGAGDVEEFDAWLKREGIASFRSVADRHYREHGFRLDGETLKVDYAAEIEEATRPLADCFQALRRLDRGHSGSPAGLFLSFFQDLRYELPPEIDAQGRQTLGFWVPTDVLARGAGDCDSKAAAFCTLWRQLPARVLLVLVPEHALVAVEGKPGPGQASIRLGNRYYILCEVAGPGRTPPGKTDYSGNFEYILIEPSG